MKCPKCNGEIEYVEDFSATSYYRVVSEDEQNIIVKHVEDDNFNTEFTLLRCKECLHKIETDKTIDFE